MKTRRSVSTQPSYQSEEEYIEKNKHIFKSVHPNLTFRQIRNKLSSEWNVLNNKPKRQTKLDDFVIQISSSPKPIQKKKQKKQTKLKVQKQQVKTKNQKLLKNSNKNQKKTRISPSSKQGPSIEIADSDSFKISLTSQEENQPILRESPIVISTNSLQIQEANQQGQKKKMHSKIKKEESKSNSNNDKNVKKSLKQKLKLPIQKISKLRKLSKLSKCKKSSNLGIPSEVQPVLTKDFINSAKQFDHICVITVSKSKIEQGQVGLDEIKNIVSHKYGIINHELNNSESLNFQLFFEVEFQPRQDGFVLQNTYCTAKQAAFYCKNLALDYIQNHKDIFTQHEEYYFK